MTQPMTNRPPRLWLDTHEISVEAHCPGRGLAGVDEFAAMERRAIADVAADFAAGRLLGVELDGERRILEVMIDPRIDRRQIAIVSRVLAPLGRSGILNFFCAPNGSLSGLTPPVARVRGQLSTTKQAARAHVER